MLKFYEDWTIRKNAPPPGSNKNLLTKFYGELKTNVASRESKLKKKAPPPGRHVFQPTDIIGTNVLRKTNHSNAPPQGRHVFQQTRFLFDREINVASRMLTRQLFTLHD
ncbi:hypothetical protein DPMN_023431 [Dreissena polymorpha]|uniref:Uncharacterized protein n=1 Tax=Dreissena polymorpha TaxID=45954 RepID=A0A9D4LM41_DREPO|nr:hypothetical protein DPMN_023431 [Dreissena polymorpha]